MAILKIHIISDLSQFSFVFNQSESVTEITPSHKMWMLAVVTPFQITVILLHYLGNCQLYRPLIIKCNLHIDRVVRN